MKEYESKIAGTKAQIQQYKDESAVLTDRIVGNDLEKDDFYFLAALDRAIHLIDGFLWVLENQKTDSLKNFLYYSDAISNLSIHLHLYEILQPLCSLQHCKNP